MSSTTAGLFIEYSIFYLIDPDDQDCPVYTGNFPTPDVTGLIAVAPNFAAITCGVYIGEIVVSVEIWNEPAKIELDSWDDVAEASTTWRASQVQVSGAAVDEPKDLRVSLPRSENGSFRIRAAVRNRDAGEDRTSADPVEEHLIQIWAAPPAPQHLTKSSDRVGAVWRRRANQPPA
ncbi:hypothetical protein [Amycolatopsis arida]|uniref:hypothetical protein n=1 Tax=Amycolatopsis arida TaxID=587909 RepID=UPI001065E922|nr:hypothetical protein [Amycolatopsis arida]